MDLINSIISYIYNMLYGIFYTIFLPFNIVFGILYQLYRTVFIFQIFMSNTCQGLFGKGFGCDIINPNYVFVNVLQYVFYGSILIFILIKTMEAYEIWKTKKK